MRTLFLLLLLIYNTISYSQNIKSPDTVCVGTNVTFSLQGGDNFITYAWSFDGGSINSINTPAIPIPNTINTGNLFNITAQSIMIYDTASNNYYMFANSAGGYSYLTPTTQRLDFGSDPNSIPAVVNLGNPFNAFYVGSYANMEAIEIVLDDNGIFHAFISNRGIVHWVFGNGLSNPPTQAIRIYDNPSVLAMAMQMCVINDNGQWRIFVGQDYGRSNIIRFDIGSNLNNIPNVLTPNILPFSNSNPCYFSIIKENNIWYLFTTSRTTNASLYKFTIGPSLQNNNPSIVNLGNTGPILNKNRGLNFLKSCDSLYLIGIDENGEVREYNFNGNINNVPTTQGLGRLYGQSFNGAQMMKPYWYKDTLWALTSDFSTLVNPSIFRRALMALPISSNSIKYYSSEAHHVFNTPGVYDVILYCDQADPRGPQTFCKQIVVVGNRNYDLGSDTALCKGDTLILGDPLNTGNFLWNNGATSSTIKVHESGTYWVNISGSSCESGSDTIKVTFHSRLAVGIDLGKDTCIHEFLLLDAGSNIGASYLWNDGSTKSTLNAFSAGTYHVTVTSDSGCAISDTITLSQQAVNKIDETACNSYTLNEETYTASGFYTQNFTIGNSTCDSIVELNLVIHDFNFPVININIFELSTTTSYDTYQWLLNGTIIANATNRTYTVAENGDYQVIVSNSDGCGDTSKIYKVTNVVETNIHTLGNSATQLKIYPNPTINSIHIIHKDAITIKKITMSNLLGQVIYNETPIPTTTNYQINTLGISSGIYFLKIETNERTYVEKIEIKR